MERNLTERVAAAEARVRRQEQILAELERDKHAAAAEVARRLLADMRQTLALLQDSRDLHDRYEIAKREDWR